MDRLVALALLVGLTSAPALALPPAPLPDEALIAEASRKLEAGDIEGALADLGKAQAAAPRDPRPRYLRGAALAKRDPTAAAAAYREALALDPGLASVHGELGALLVDGGKLDEARPELKAAVKLDPAGADAWINLAKLETRQGHEAAAESAWAEAERRLPADAEVRIDHAVALRKAGRHDDAIRVAREAVSLDAASAPAQQALGFALQSAGRLDEAVTALGAAARLDPRSASAAWALGVAERDRKHDAPALAALERACQLDCRPPIAADLAALQLRLARPAQAVATLRGAAASHPRSLAIQIELGKALAATGQCAEARALLDKLPRQPVVAAAQEEARTHCAKATPAAKSRRVK